MYCTNFTHTKKTRKKNTSILKSSAMHTMYFTKQVMLSIDKTKTLIEQIVHIFLFTHIFNNILKSNFHTIMILTILSLVKIN